MIKDIIAIAYQLVDATESELPYITVLGQYGVVSTIMQNEKILGYKNKEIIKSSISFGDNSGIANDTLSNFVEDVIYLEFNSQSIPEITVDQIKTYNLSGLQAIAFYQDYSTGTAVAKAQQSIPLAGTLTVWYEPRPLINRGVLEDPEIENAYLYLMATRLAYACVKYIIYEDVRKDKNKIILLQGLREQAEEAKILYKTAMNRIDNGNKPFSRLPFISV